MTKTRKAGASVLMGLMLGVMGGAAWGHTPFPDPTPGNDLDQLMITIHPSVDRGVQITTTSPAGMLDLGPVEMQKSTFTVSPATVTILGTHAAQELDISAAITAAAGANAWSFDLTPSTYAVGPAPSMETDALAMYALFSNTSLAARPTGDDFALAASSAGFADGSVGSTFDATRVGGKVGHPRAECNDALPLDSNGRRNDTCFEYLGTHDMDNLTPTTQKHLWFLLRTPLDTTVSEDQRVTVTLTAVSGT